LQTVSCDWPVRITTHSNNNLQLSLINLHVCVAVMITELYLQLHATIVWLKLCSSSTQ